ncbi:MAG: Rpn family recombination-promoting nuclease/putative transposase, partial [Bacteroidota bacterium]
MDQELVAVLKLETLTLMRDSYVDEELKVTYSDLVFRCMTQAENEIEICLLIEHKSYVPVRPRLQLLQYLLNAWKAQIKAEKLTLKRTFPLRPVVPILLYHGQAKWKDSSLKDYFHEVDGIAVEKYVPDFFYELIDLNTYSAEEVARMDLGMLELTVSALKFSRNVDLLLEQFEHLAGVMEIHGSLR